VSALSIEVRGTEVIAADLTRLAEAGGSPVEALTEMGAWLLVTLWDRIAGRPTSAYAESYRRWLVRTGEISGKLLGVLTGALIGSSAPGPAGGGDLDMRLGESEALVGFVDPQNRAKAAGFNAWYQSKFGEPAIGLRAGDEEALSDIFDRKVQEALDG